MEKQERLPGTEDQLIKEIVDIAEEYQEIRDQRMALNKQESTLQQRLLEAMKRHDLNEYVFDGKRVFVVAGKQKVRVRSIDSETEEVLEEEEPEE